MWAQLGNPHGVLQRLLQVFGDLVSPDSHGWPKGPPCQYHCSLSLPLSLAHSFHLCRVEIPLCPLCPGNVSLPDSNEKIVKIGKIETRCVFWIPLCDAVACTPKKARFTDTICPEFSMIRAIYLRSCTFKVENVYRDKGTAGVWYIPLFKEGNYISFTCSILNCEPCVLLCVIKHHNCITVN